MTQIFRSFVAKNIIFCIYAAFLFHLLELIQPIQGFTPSSRAILSTHSITSKINSELYGASDALSNDSNNRKNLHEVRKIEWISRSVNYYSRVMRDKTGKDKAAIEAFIKSSRPSEENMLQNKDEQEYRTFMDLATRHYFARHKIKNLQPRHAERIYRKTIDEIMKSRDADGEHCDHAALAVSTLLLALLLQRMGDVKGTRSVFVNFFRVVIAHGEGPKECRCSAKVLQAYALFEMKRGNSRKSLELVTKAVSLDKSLAPVLRWKQFRDVKYEVSRKN